MTGTVQTQVRVVTLFARFGVVGFLVCVLCCCFGVLVCCCFPPCFLF